MIHELAKFFTNYDSWQYLTVALSLTVGGGILAAWKKPFMLLSVMGQVMLVTLLNNQVSVDNLKGVTGMASTLPIIFIAFCMITDFKVLTEFGSADKKDGEKTTKGDK